MLLDSVTLPLVLQLKFTLHPILPFLPDEYTSGHNLTVAVAIAMYGPRARSLEIVLSMQGFLKCLKTMQCKFKTFYLNLIKFYIMQHHVSIPA